MNVVHTLAAIFITVEYGSESAFCNPAFFCNGCCNTRHTAHSRIVLGFQIVECGNVLTRDDQNMCRSRRIDILKRHNEFVLIDEGGRDFTQNNFAKQAGIGQRKRLALRN